MTGPDYQILDGHGKTGYANEIAKGNLSGAFYDFLPSKVEWCKPAAEWNEGSIKVQGTKVTLTVNGHLSAEVDTASDDWKQKLAKSKFASWPRFARDPRDFSASRSTATPSRSAACPRARRRRQNRCGPSFRPSHAKYVSSCEYGGAQQQRNRSGSSASIWCQAPAGIKMASPTVTSRVSPSISILPLPSSR